MCDLSIVGVPLRVVDKFVPLISMRKIYNMKCFRDERYRHEVANHYRDFKLQQRFPENRWNRRGRCHLRPLAPRVSLLASSYAQFRGQLPTHVHYFPRFGDTYPARGRKTICSSEVTDEPYSDSLRRIRKTQSCDQLKELVQRQFARQKAGRDKDSKTGQGRVSGNGNECVQRDHGGISSGSSSRRGSNNYKQRVSNISTVKLENLQKQHRIDLYTYLQVANRYYEQGLHANIKYLQSIGQRNIINQLQQQQHQHQRKNQLRRYSLEALPQHRTVDLRELVTNRKKLSGRLSSILKSLRQGQSWQTAEQSNKTDAISVHITPVHGAAIAHHIHSSSMCDYVKNNNISSSNINVNGNNSSGSSSNNSALPDQQQRKLYEIIDNLSQLSLCNIDNQLPLITLTDYTQQLALNGANFDITGNCQLQIPNEARPPTYE